MINGWNAERARKLREDLMAYFKDNADENGYLDFNASAFARDYGIDSSTIHRIMKTFGQKKMIEYVRNGYGTIVKVCDGYMKKKPVEIAPIKPVDPVKAPKLRVCRKCGSVAHNDESRFCWLCGDSLFTAKELLKERCERHIPKMARAINDQSICNESLYLFGELMRFAFDEK